MKEDWDKSGNWSHDDDMMWEGEENWDEVDLEDTDWFGALVNPDCQPDCTVSDCFSG
jgi:hypothetical protein